MYVVRNIGSSVIRDKDGMIFYSLWSVVNMEIWLSIWPVNLPDSGGRDPGWAWPAVTSQPCAVALPPLCRSTRPLLVLTSALCLASEGGREESSSTRYCGWYNGLCIWSCYCLGCGEVIQWHFNRLSDFFAVALVLISRIKTQSVRHWTCCLVVEQRGSAVTSRTAAHTSPHTDRDMLISEKFSPGDVRLTWEM